MLSSAKDTIGGFGRGIKDTFFTKGGLDNYNKNYDAQFSLEDFSSARGGYNNVNINFKPVQGYIKGSANNNLSSQQQQQFDMAIRNGDMATAKHYEMIARSNDARNQFARENSTDIKLAQQGGVKGDKARERLEKAIGSGKKYNNLTLGMSSLSSIIKHGGSVVTAVDNGRFIEGGTFKSAKAAGDGDGIGVAGDKGPIETPSNTVTTSSSSDDDPNQISFTPPTVEEASIVVSNIIDDITSSSSNETSASTAAEQIQASIDQKAARDAAAAATRRSNDNKPSLAEKMSKAAQDRQKQANKFTASKIADYKKTGRATGFKEGGLMKGKK